MAALLRSSCQKPIKLLGTGASEPCTQLLHFGNHNILENEMRTMDILEHWIILMNLESDSRNKV